jgi:hypothetical protein
MSRQDSWELASARCWANIAITLTTNYQQGSSTNELSKLLGMVGTAARDIAITIIDQVLRVIAC